ncbi:uncharacterized protein [Macaca nemestrina]|uniref:uncharacterized protein n=1 Tax=Macaca nemestrina TaxID=9545 RepID=UPI0039B8C715
MCSYLSNILRFADKDFLRHHANPKWRRERRRRRQQSGGGCSSRGRERRAPSAPPTSHSSLLAFFPTVPRSARLRPRSAHARPQAYECLRASRWLLPPTTTFGRPARQPARTRSPTGTSSPSPPLSLRPCQAGSGAGPHAYLKPREPKPPPPPLPAPTATNRRQSSRCQHSPTSTLQPSRVRLPQSPPPRGTVPFLSAAGAGEEWAGKASLACRLTGIARVAGRVPRQPTSLGSFLRRCGSPPPPQDPGERIEGCLAPPLPAGGWRPQRLRVGSFPAE